ncbi:MAG: helix-turn-helix transcriptional regulator [Dechloromonas sp.]|nr:helix-turn-helix transcriptional regulator [Dechloromonas sp.]
METLADRIIHIRRDILGFTQAKLAAVLGITRGAVGNWERGGDIDKRHLLRIAELAGAPVEWIVRGSGRPPIGKPIPLDQFREVSDEMLQDDRNYRPPPQLLGRRDLPVYAAVEGGPGAMVVSTDPIDMVPRPWFFERIRDAFVVVVVGDSMEPAYEPGDMALVNPKLTPIRNKDAIFIAGEPEGDFRASIKRLIRSTDQEYVVRQFNPPKEITLPKKEWTTAYRVVGKYTG